MGSPTAGMESLLFDCEECGKSVYSDTDEWNFDGENCICEACVDKWEAEQKAYWYPLYLGEKLAGFIK